MPLDAAEGAPVLEHDACPVAELEHEARETRQLFSGRNDRPVAGHPEMHLQRGPVIEAQQLVFAPPLHPLDGAAAQCTKVTRLEPSPDIRVEQARSGNGNARGGAREIPRGAFNFGKLGHGAECTLRPVPAQERG